METKLMPKALVAESPFTFLSGIEWAILVFVYKSQLGGSRTDFQISAEFTGKNVDISRRNKALDRLARMGFVQFEHQSGIRSVGMTAAGNRFTCPAKAFLNEIRAGREGFDFTAWLK